MIENKKYSKEEYVILKKEYLKYQKDTQKTSSVASIFRSENVCQAVFCSDVYNGRNIVMASRDDSGNKTNLFDVMST
jgi:V8-like Glu-specific endopeptidase